MNKPKRQPLDWYEKNRRRVMRGQMKSPKLCQKLELEEPITNRLEQDLFLLTNVHLWVKTAERMAEIQHDPYWSGKRHSLKWLLARGIEEYTRIPKSIRQTFDDPDYQFKEIARSASEGQVATEVILDFVDTIEWPAEKWNHYFLAKHNLAHQIENFQNMVRFNTLIADPRQHGKTSFCVEPALIRRLCETKFIEYDMPYMYITHSNDKAKRMIMACRYELMLNEPIIQHYGKLIDRGREGNLQTTSQTHYHLNLITLRNKQLISLQGLSIESKIRGETTMDLFIDDPIDIKELKGKDPKKATEDFMFWYQTKIEALVKRFTFITITRYAPKDICQRFIDMGTFKVIIRQAVIAPVNAQDQVILPVYSMKERAIDIDDRKIPYQASDVILAPDHQMKLLAPELWAYEPKNPAKSGDIYQNILFKHYKMTDPIFKRELMNAPSSLTKTLEWLRLTPYTVLPRIAYSEPLKMNWVISGDIASGERKEADHTAFVLIGFWEQDIYLHDMLYGHWTGLDKQEQLEAFVIRSAQHLKLNNPDIQVILEGFGHRDFFNRIRDESWITPIDIAPSGQGEKIRRIRYGFGQEMQLGKVFLFDRCRNTHQLKDEIDGFPSTHPDLLDACNQAYYWKTEEFVEDEGIMLTI